MVTSTVLYHFLNFFHISIEVRNVCVFLAPLFSSLTSLVTYKLTSELFSGMYIRGMLNSEARVKLRGIKVVPDLERNMGGSGKVDYESEF